MGGDPERQAGLTKAWGGDRGGKSPGQVTNALKDWTESGPRGLVATGTLAGARSTCRDIGPAT